MESTILNDESFEDFLGNDFDIKSFSANILQTKLVADYLQHLNELIRTLDAEIKQQVSSNAPILFRQASSIGTIEDVLENMQSRIGSLKSTVDRISSKVTEPYNKILIRKNQLTRLQNTCDLLRRIKGIMQQKQKLESFMAPSKTGQQQIELVKASQCLSELDHFTVDADFTGIDAVEKDLQFVFKARHDIQNQAQDALENGLEHLNPAQIGTALQVFFNLGTLDDRVQSIEQRLLDNFQSQITDYLDLKQLSKNKDPTNPGRTTMPNIGNTPQFRALLWTNIEKILDLIYTYVAQLSNLARVLAKKKDPITHSSFIAELIKHGHSGELVGKFWVGAMKALRKQLRTSVSDSFHLRQALEGEYPKLLKLQNDLINRLNQLQPGFSEIEMTNIDEEFNDSEPINATQKTNLQLNQCFDIFEKSYLSISLSRLSDPINLMFSSNTTKLLPSQQELENLIKVMINELSVSTVSEFLVNKVARNIAKAIQLFAAKCEQSV
jgi:rRNA processing protein Gar1